MDSTAGTAEEARPMSFPIGRQRTRGRPHQHRTA